MVGLYGVKYVSSFAPNKHSQGIHRIVRDAIRFDGPWQFSPDRSVNAVAGRDTAGRGRW